MALIDGGASDDLEGHAPLRSGGRSSLEAQVAALPPLPEQDLCQMRAEACCGNSLVLFLIFLFVAPMQAFANAARDDLTMLQRIWIFFIYAEAATAIFCLLGLMWDDPGTVKRTPENCFPQPDIVADRLARGQSLDNVGNMGGDDGRVFCIRCLVWRPDDANTHHCSTCQRCVTEFDHHCGVRAPPFSLPPPPPSRPPPSPLARASSLTPLASLAARGRCLVDASPATGVGATWATSRHSS